MATPSKTVTKKRASGKASGKKVAKKFEKRDIKKSFWFKLTADEKKHHADEMVRFMTEKGKKELQFADVKKKWQGEIKGLETEVEEHRQVYGAGKEWREVDCVEVKDFQKLEVRYTMGKKVMESRKMDEREKQMALQVKGKPIDNKKNANGNGKLDKKTGEIRDVMKDETSKNTKKSAVDGPKIVTSNSSAYQELHGGGAV